jgi:hypothetical protein
METQKLQSSGGELRRGIGYVALTVVILGCLIYAFAIDTSGKNVGALGIAFAAFVAIIALANRGRVSTKRHDECVDAHRPHVNPATGLPMMNGHIDSGGNPYGSRRSYD